jgi:putative ABC transport system substrate-binding protein
MTRVLSLVTLILALLAAPLAVEAQPARGVHRIGFLGNSTAALEAHLVGPFREGLRELGYVEGQNLVIEYRWAEGQYERFPTLIAELLALKVDVIVTAGTPATQPSRRQQRRSLSSWWPSAILWPRGSSPASGSPVGTSPD